MVIDGHPLFASYLQFFSFIFSYNILYYNLQVLFIKFVRIDCRFRNRNVLLCSLQAFFNLNVALNFTLNFAGVWLMGNKLEIYNRGVKLRSCEKLMLHVWQQF
jgi:hypothetical protein